MRCQIGGTLRPGSGGILPGVFGKRNSVVCDVLEPVTPKQLSCSRPKSLRLTECGDCGESLVSRNEVTCSWLEKCFTHLSHWASSDRSQPPSPDHMQYFIFLSTKSLGKFMSDTWQSAGAMFYTRGTLLSRHGKWEMIRYCYCCPDH